MGDGVSVNIQKLGHSLEEIRVRALDNIISKLDRGLVSVEQLLDEPDLFPNLVYWFKQKTVPHKSTVLKLILRLCKVEDDVILRFLRFDPGFENISLSVREDERGIFKELCDLGNITLPHTKVENIPKLDQKDFSEILFESDEEHHYNLTRDSFKRSSASKICCKSQNSKIVFDSQNIKPLESGVDIVWPCPHLNNADTSVLDTVYSSLRDSEQCSQAMYFFSTVVVNDFPPQVFLRNSAILLALFDLLASDSTDEYVLMCFESLTRSLIRYLHFCADPAVISANVTKAKEEVLVDIGAGGDSVTKPEEALPSHPISQPAIVSFSLDDYSGMLLERLGTQLSRSVELLKFCVPDFINLWTHSNSKKEVLKSSIKSTFIKLATKLKKSKSLNAVSRLEAQLSVYKILKAALPIETSKAVVPKELQEILVRNLLDPILYILYPEVHKLFLSYAEVFKKHNETVYHESDEVAQSLESAAYFLNHATEMKMDKILSVFQSSLISLEFHQQYRIIPVFFDLVISKYELEISQLETAQEIVLSLLSSSDNFVKSSTYESYFESVSKYLGPEKCLTKDDPIPRLGFIINCKSLNEIVSFGLTSNDIQIRKWSESSLILVLKSQILLPNRSWRWLISELSAVWPTLQSFSSHDSALGKIVSSILDPDMGKLLHLTELQVLMGNIRLMFSKDQASYEEGKIRLLYMLKVPADRCAMAHPFHILEDVVQVKANPSCNYAEESLLRVMEVISSCSDEDRPLMKSALTQLSLITEDPSLHIMFLDNNGLNMLTKFLYSYTDDLEDDAVHFYSPIIVILKNLVRHNIQLRLDFSVDLQLCKHILKGLFIFKTEWRHQREIAQLLSLIAYADVILSTSDTVSFPLVLLDRIKIPFDHVSHAKVSQYTVPSKKSRLLSNKTVECSLALRWCVAQSDGNIEEVLTKDLKDLSQAPLLPVSLQSLRDLKESHIVYNIRALLHSLSMAICHVAANDTIQLLKRYLHLLEITKNEDELNKLSWEIGFLRYLTTLPASVADQTLLVQIIRCLTIVVECLPCQKKWISELFQDPSSVLCTLLTQILVADSTHLDKEVSVEILTLLQLCLQRSSKTTWEHTLKILVQCLTQSHSHKFYSLAILDKLLKCLLKIISFKLVFSPTPLWQLVNAFHCSSEDSFMGITITRSNILCLSNLLALRTKGKSKEWMVAELKWFTKLLASRDVLVKSAALELLSGLCQDRSSADTVLSIIPSLWEISLSILLDHNEASLTREQAAILCSNIFVATQNKSYVKLCTQSGLFECLPLIASRFNFHPSINQNAFFQELPGYTNVDQENYINAETVSSITTPTLLIVSCNFVLNLMVKDKEEVMSQAYSQGFILELFRQVRRWLSNKVVFNQDVVDMYTSVFKLLSHYTEQVSATIKECIPVLVWLLQDSTFTKNLDRSDLNVQIIHLLGSIVNNQQDVNIIFTKEAMDTICSLVQDLDEPFHIETAVCITHIAPYLTSDANIELVKGVKGNDLAERMFLGGILGTSHAGTLVALERGFLESSVMRLKEIFIELTVIPPDIPRNKKANSALFNLWVEFNLLTNFLAGCVDAKEKCAHLGLADAIHKVWPWCLLDVPLLNSLLQVLINFTADSVLASSTLVLTSTMPGVGQRKTTTSNSLLHAVIALHSKDIYGNDVKKLLLELMIHACQAQECRTVINKSNTLNEFLKLDQQKKTSSIEELEAAWLEFLEVYSSFVEGQTTIIKNEHLMTYITNFITANKHPARVFAVSVVRNLMFNTINKQKFIASDKLLKALSELLLEDTLADRESQDIALISWYLVANSQRGKNAVKTVGLLSRLKLASSKNPESHLVPLINNIDEIFNS